MASIRYAKCSSSIENRTLFKSHSRPRIIKYCKRARLDVAMHKTIFEWIWRRSPSKSITCYTDQRHPDAVDRYPRGTEWKNIQTRHCYVVDSINGLVQNCSISIANALEILQSCTKPSLCLLHNWMRVWTKYRTWVCFRRHFQVYFLERKKLFVA